MATASAQEIDLTASIRRGIEEAGRYLEANMISFSTYVSSQDLSSNHFNAVHYTGTQPNARRRFSLEQIVVDGRNANYWSAEDDRYEAKYDMYKLRDEREMWPLFKDTGLPVVTRPMPRPAAAQARDGGSWTASLADLMGGSLNIAVKVAVSFVDQTLYVSPTNAKNGQSALSDSQTVVLATGKGLTVDVTDLTFPDGTLPPEQMARGFIDPLVASGWNIWVGTTTGPMYLQNASPIPAATKTFTFSADPIFAGFKSGLGQYAEAYYTIPKLFFRG